MSVPAMPDPRSARGARLGLALLGWCVLTLPLPASAAAGSKNEQTNYFYQMDPDAGFEGDGSNFCAPTSVSNGLIYLARARGLTELVDGAGRQAQIALIKKLAEHMETDPDIGTNPSKIIYGLQEYLESRGYTLDHLQLAGWRRIDEEHRQYLVTKKPTLKWLREAADDPDAVLILNNGWYRQTDDGGYRRKGGHFVIGVGSGPGESDLLVHNSAMEVDEQKDNTVVTLAPITESLVADAKSNGVEELELEGYYTMKGPGLPFSSKKAAFSALDFVIVFKVKK